MNVHYHMLVDNVNKVIFRWIIFIIFYTKKIPNKFVLLLNS